MAHWHGLAKLRMHTDATLAVLDSETSVLGNQLRDFQSNTCSAYKTCELDREMAARKRRQERSDIDHHSRRGRQPATLSLSTYKFHALGDYVSTIKQYGTTDSYTTAIVSKPLRGLRSTRGLLVTNAVVTAGRIGAPRGQSDV